MISTAKFDAPAFGLGCAPIGNLYRPLPDAQAIAARQEIGRLE